MEDHVRHRVDRRFSVQHGAASRGQLLSDGLTARVWDRRTGRGYWLLVDEEVVRLPGAPETWEQAAVIACLTVPGSLTSRRPAGALWRLHGAKRGLIEVTTRRWERRRRVRFRVHETLDLSESDRAMVSGIPVTSPARTLIDLAAVLPDERLIDAFDSAERQGLVTRKEVEIRFLELAKKGRPGIARMRRILTHRTGQVPDSKFERRTERLLVEAGEPQPVLQFEVALPDGSVAEFDLAYPWARVAIECDSQEWHGATRFQHDRTRQNAVVLLGWTVLRFTWRDLVERPGCVVATVHAALAAAR